MVAEEQTPLAVLGNGRSMGKHVNDRMPILAADTHEQPRHQGKMKRHVTFITVAEIRADIGGPLIRFPQQDASLITLDDPLSTILQILFRLTYVFATGVLPLQ